MEDESPQTGVGAQHEASDTPANEEPQAAAEASATAADVPSYTAQVEQTGPCARLLRIEVSKDKVVEEIDNSYRELRNTVFIRGFRKGHVPRHVLERRFGEQVLESVKQGLVDDHFNKAVDDNSLSLALPADIDYDAVTFDPAQPLAFEVKVEVTPEFTIDNYKGLEVQRPAVTVTDDDVTRALDAFRMRHGQYRKIEQGQVTNTDVPVCHAVALENGEEIWRQDELGAHIGDETLGGITVPGLRDALLGASPGDSKTLKTTLPDAFPDEAHRGKTVDLEITIDEIRRFEAPEATDEWAKSRNFDSLVDLREEMHDELRRTRDQEADDAVQTRIADRLLELTDFDVPDGLVERLVTSTRERQRLALLYRGIQEDQLDGILEQQDKATRDTSVRNCKLHFIYQKIAEQDKVFVTEEEIQQRIQAIALNYKRRPEEVADELETEGRMSALRQQMREEKVRDYLVQHADVHETEPPPADDQPDPGATTVVEPPADTAPSDADAEPDEE